MSCNCIAPEYHRQFDPINRYNELKQISLIENSKEILEETGYGKQKMAFNRTTGRSVIL